MTLAIRPDLQSLLLALVSRAFEMGPDGRTDVFERFWRVNGGRMVQVERKSANWNRARELPEYAAFTAAIAELLHESGLPSSPSQEPFEQTADGVAATLLSTVRRAGDGPADPAVAQFLASVLASLSAGRFCTRAIAPLRHFDATVEPLDLGGDLTIECMGPAELEVFADHIVEPKQTATAGLPYAIVKRSWRPLSQLRDPIGGKEFSYDYALGEISSLVHFLRFFKPGKLSAPILQLTIEAPFSGGGAWGSISTASWVPGAYRLEAAEAEILMREWRMLQAHPRKSPLSLAIRRLSAAEESHRTDDKTLDLVIAAEALLLSDISSDRNELSFRAALRAAHLLGGTASDKRRTFELVKHAYDARSSVAHGGLLDLARVQKKLGLNEYEFIRALEEFIRQGVRAMLGRPEFQDKTSKPWDDLTFG